MNFFKKKPQHQPKKKTSTVQVTIKAPHWTPPFQNAGKRQQANPIDSLIAAANVAKEQLSKKEMNFQNHLLVTGQDIDYVVAMMCYVQMSLLGVAGYFKVGNSLTGPMSSDDNLDDYWFTPMCFFPVWHFRRIFRSMDNLFQPVNEEQDDGS